MSFQPRAPTRSYIRPLAFTKKCYTRAEAAQRAEEQADRAYWDEINRVRMEGEQAVKDEGKHEKQQE